MQKKYLIGAIAAVGAAIGGALLLTKVSAQPTRYSCVGGQCVQDPNGQYDSLAACQAVCGGGGAGPTLSITPQSASYLGTLITINGTGYSDVPSATNPSLIIVNSLGQGTSLGLYGTPGGVISGLDENGFMAAGARIWIGDADTRPDPWAVAYALAPGTYTVYATDTQTGISSNSVTLIVT